jgi:hypothetical protein
MLWLEEAITLFKFKHLLKEEYISMNELVIIKNDVPVTTTLIIAEETGVAHNSVIKLVRA